MAESAEPDVESTEEVESQEPVASESAGAQAEPKPQEQKDPTDADKVVEKLQKRIGKEQAEKNGYKDKYEAAMKQIEALQKGEDPEKEPEPDENQKKISALEAQIKHRDMLDQARTVITEAGFSVPAGLLDALVVDDDKQTLANVKAVVEYTNSVQEGVRKQYLKGKTPRVAGAKAKAITKSDFNHMSFADKMKLAGENPQLYTKLINE